METVSVPLPVMSRIPIYVDSQSRGQALINVRPTEKILFLKYLTLDVFKYDDVDDKVILSERVFYNGRKLDDEKTLLDYGITQPGAILVALSLDRVPEMPSIPINVYSTSRGSKIIQVRPTKTILFAKHLASVTFEDHDVLSERVFYKDEELNDDRTLLECGITQPHAYLVLVSPVMPVFPSMCIQNPEVWPWFFAPPTATINFVRREPFATFKDLRVLKERILYNGRELDDDDRTLF